MQKQVSVYKNNLPGDKSKIATVEEAVVFLRKCDVVML